MMFAATVPLLFSFFIFPIVSRGHIVQIDQGTLSGTVHKSREGNEFHAFYGIPYAQPPVNELRFQPPKLPPPSWPGIRNATQKPSYCTQNNTWFGRGFFGSEDCLFLNVYTRNTTPGKLMPVLTFIHGGAYTGGGGTLAEADFLMDQPIVYVTMNYRLGVFGFLSTGESFSSGNYGLKDQVAALKWIQKNIQSFGGDPTAVTIMGQSAGAASVHLHTLSSSSTNLFHRAILQSGVGTLSWSHASAQRAKKTFLNFQKHTNCSRPTTTESVACLSNLSAKNLAELEQSFKVPNPMTKFSPVIEPLTSDDAFLVVDPNEMAYPAPLKPIIFGYTSNEVIGFGPMMRGFFPPNMTDEKVFYADLPKKLNYETPNDPELTKKITTLIKKVYFQDDLSNLKNEATATKLLSDLFFKVDIVDAAQKYPGIRYVYEYDYTNGPRPKELGAGHSEDLRQFFPMPEEFRHKPDPSHIHGADFRPKPEQNNSRQVSKIMLTYWTNFISSGDPNTPEKEVPTQWISTQNDAESMLIISNDGFHTKPELAGEKGELWSLYRKSDKYKSNEKLRL